MQYLSVSFSSIVEKHKLMNEICVSEHYYPRINIGLIRTIKSRGQLKKKAIKTVSDLLSSSYKYLRNKVNRLNFDLNRKYFTETIHNSEGNMKDTWKTLNQLMNKRSKTTNTDHLKQEMKAISGIDGISSYFLELAFSIIAHSLVLKFNKFSGTTIFPNSWITARVIPIFKDSERDEKSNYRPNSILPVSSKLFESWLSIEIQLN